MRGVTAEAISAPAEQAGETFEELYRRSFRRVYAYTASMLRDRAAAEEVTAEAFERAWRKRRSYRPGRGSAEAWVVGIARNAALDELRRRKRRGELADDTPDIWSEPPEEAAELALRRRSLRAALGTLDAREREIVALKFSAGLSNSEIAGVLGLSESNAGTKLHRVMEKLRRACDDDA
ncbi:MAG TPA: sigma-70 family RNA polymerase sigma factor [Thermoleophilaceae bacterium]|nr:sigma-70 family RNA polymerase sigma factor [Thermoleophilaceae bacterium]